jgi:hypothetical protein
VTAPRWLLELVLCGLALAAGTAGRGGELTLTGPALWLEGVQVERESDCAQSGF